MASRPTAASLCPPEAQKVSCGMKSLLELVTGPWTLHILSLFMTNGPMRFGLIRRSIDGISPRLLTVRLRALEERGLVTRSVKPSNPPEVTYIPTSRLRTKAKHNFLQGEEASFLPPNLARKNSQRFRRLLIRTGI